jgi:hypothetical protein
MLVGDMSIKQGVTRDTQGAVMVRWLRTVSCRVREVVTGPRAKVLGRVTAKVAVWGRGKQETSGEDDVCVCVWGGGGGRRGQMPMK